MIVNDEYRNLTGNIRMLLPDDQNREVARSDAQFRVTYLSGKTYNLVLKLPQATSSYWLLTYAEMPDGSKTLCRRKVKFV